MSNRQECLQLFANQFTHERDLASGVPSPEYYWYRKRNCVVRLLRDNLHLLPKTRPDGSNNRVIEIGCGSGRDLYLIRDCLHKERPEMEYLGLEGHHVSFELCLLRKQHFGLDDVNFQNVDFTNGLPCADASADLVYCSEVIEHIADPKTFFKEIRRVTRPHGLLILTTPNEPNAFQKAFWSPRAHARLMAARQKMRENPIRIAKVAGNDVPIYGHISCETSAHWDRMASEVGFQIKDFQRGAIVYGGTKFHNRNFVLGLRFLLESLLDHLPKQLVRRISDQVIGLYQLVG